QAKMYRTSATTDLEEKLLISTNPKAPPMTDKKKRHRLFVFLGVLIVMSFVGICPFHHLLKVTEDDELKYKAPEFDIDSLSLILNNEEAYWRVTFSIKNPRENATVRYYSGQVSMIYEKGFLSTDLITPFRLRSEEERLVYANFETYSIDRKCVKKMAVDFFVLMKASIVDPRPGSYRESVALLRINCKTASIEFPVNNNGMVGIMSGGKRKCKVVMIDNNRK
ncbi:unnamed protein product, partial [Ilex paraguariensis]